ncbi:hypothetical protein [Enterococcus lactis]|uniref:hypothetical protein n=2 Tax=Enterococcus lactis TaxID=357441 RepID=UPI0034E98C53
MKKLSLLLLLSVFLFVGCGSKNAAAKHKSETTETSIATTMTSTTKSSSSSKSETSNSETATTENSSSDEINRSTATSSPATTQTSSTSLTTDNSSSPTESTAPASSSAVTDNTEVSSTTQTSNEKPTITNDFPYAVDPGRFNTATTFQFRGANVPASVTLENNNGQMTMTSTPKSGGEATVYTATIETIPTTSIRIFSYAGNAVRTVKVNTKINLLNKLSSANTADQSGPFYVFENSNGGLSLITPNYAGNIYVDQTDIMLEAVH